MLCMDNLSHLIEQKVISENWIAVKMGSLGPRIYFLMFVDDLILFGEATKEQMSCVMDTLQKFCSLTCQKVSEEKSSILFSKNVTRCLRQKLLHISKFRETIQFDKYLGIPLNGNNLGITNF